MKTITGVSGNREDMSTCKIRMCAVGKALLAALGLALLTGQAANAQQTDAVSLHTESHLKSLAEGLLNRTPAPKLIDVLRDVFYRSDVDGSGEITEEDALIRVQINHAKRREHLYSYWASHDVNSDAVVTIEEIRQVYLPEARGALLGFGVAATSVDEADIQARLDALLSGRLEDLFDFDNNGVFTFEEVVSGAEERHPAGRDGIARLVRDRGRRWSPPILVTPLFDENGDGRVTEVEFLTPYESLLNSYDLDGDGVINAQELEPLSTRANENFARRQETERSLWLD
ncbi:MAG: hypothetical protein AAFU80_25290 [Pseudomonadota bacterium]